MIAELHNGGKYDPLSRYQSGAQTLRLTECVKVCCMSETRGQRCLEKRSTNLWELGGSEARSTSCWRVYCRL